MKQSLKTFLPAFIVIITGAFLTGWYYLGIPVMHIGIQLKGNGMLGKLVNLMGDGAIALGAASFSWFIFKKRLKDSSRLVKFAGKKIYHLHAYFGWTALIFVTLHGAYYLMTDAGNRRILTGIAAFLILAGIGVYGSLVKRFKNRYIKKAHFMLTITWLVPLFIHGGSLVVVAFGGLVGLYIFLSLLKSEEKQIAPKPKRKASAL